MARRLVLAALAFAGACASASSFDVNAMQRTLDDRGFGFGVTRVPGHDAFVFQVRFSTSDTEADLNADPMAAAQAAAPPGCTVSSVTPQEDGASFRVEYDC